MNKRRLVIGGLGLITALGISSLSMSLAWYSSGTRLMVSSVDISFIGAKNIKLGVSPDGEFKEALDKELNQIDNYYPVSSMFSSRWMDNKESLPKFRNSYKSVDLNDKSTYQESTEATGGYFQQELYLYSDFNVWVTLDKEMVTFTPDIEKNKERAQRMKNTSSESYEEILRDLNSVTDALRFSILNPQEDEYNYYIIDPYKEKDTYLCGPLDNSQDGYYDHINGQEIIYGEYDEEEEIIYDEPRSEDSHVDGRRTVFNASHKKGIKPFNEDQLHDNKMKAHIEDSLAKNEIEDNLEIKLEAQEPKKIVVSLYLEGWDTQNVDYSAFGSFNASLGFKIRREH